MEKENIQPTDFTYRILIDAKGQSNDITGMEQIFETVKADEDVRERLRCRAINLGWPYKTLAAEVEKADSILQKAAQHTFLKPKVISYLAMMEEYSMRGDVHNSEKMFYQMRQAGYVCRIRQFELLIQAYINAKAPSYGVAERMKADNRQLAVALNNSHVQLWDTLQGSSQLLRTLQGHRLRVGSLDWNGGHILTTGGMNSMIINNDVRVGSHRYTEFPNPMAITLLLPSLTN
ncbi:hypothetical protein T459_31258 [Capsicum annuum]|uniref:Uncharacterized protein n=1 Tax=Capsicum annuum TaxID=4072 RepID=A0A2G2YAQ1_CAPAN|nr:hypothetical protein T459_31258 [Capsicum annuum]